MSLLSNFSFPKELKIRKTSQYEEFFGKSKKLRGERFDILYASNSLGYSRVGLIAGKKKVPSAVGRNRVKRVLREVFRKNKSLFGSLDIVFIANRGSESLTYSQAKREIEDNVRSILS